MTSPASEPPDTAARLAELRSIVTGPQARELRENARAEEAARLAGTGLDAAERERAAAAHAQLIGYYAFASLSESRYDADNKQAQALDDAIAAISAAREDGQHRYLAPDRKVRSALQAARLFSQRYEVMGAAADLDRALAISAEAAELARRAAPELLAEALELHGNQLAADFDRNASRQSIDRAVGVLREACALAAPQASRAGRPAVSLAAALLLRAKGLGRVADLDEAERLLRRTLTGLPGTAAVLDALGCVLIARAEQTGSVDDLDKAVDAGEQAVKIAPDDPWFRASLAVALRQRYTARGDRADDRRAVSLLEQALREIPEGAPDRLRLVQNFSPSLPAAELVARARALLEATPPGARSRTARQGALAFRLIEQYQETLNPALLAEALAICEEGLRTADRGSVDRPNLLGHLASAQLLTYATRGGDGQLLDQAIGTATEALRSAPDASPERATFALTLAEAWSLRGSTSRSPEDLGQATAAFRMAAALGQRRDPGTALRAGREWGAWAAEEERWPEAADALDGALHAAEELYRRQAGRGDREAWLKAAPGLPASAAEAAARAGTPERAVLALERGRARMLSDALDRDRAEVDDLRDGDHAELAERFTAAAAALAARERSHNSAREQDEAAVLAARAAFDGVVEAIHAVPGHEHFLAPPVFADVAAAAGAAGCPLVYIASANTGVVAAVRPGGQAVVRLLPGLDERTTLARAASLIAASRRREQDPAGWQAELTRATDWLGQVAWPAVLAAAGPCDRVVLVPVGLLGLLPLHAAARPDPAAATGRRYALDDVLISYAPNARALTASRKLAGRVTGESVLAVGAPDHTGQAHLRYGDTEARLVRDAFNAGRPLLASDATRENVLGALAGFDVLHFACHGRTDLFDPLAGGLLLAGQDTLTLRDVLGLRLPGARLAVLSACESAVSGAELPDEVISLSAGLLQAGCAAAVGSLWQVPDASTLLLMSYFVRQWRQRRGEPAEALRRAQQQVRDVTNRELAASNAPGLGSRPADPRLLEIWASRRPYAHPHAWAGFTYMGA